MQNFVNSRALSRICAIVIMLVLVVAVPVSASEITEPLLEKTISFKANFVCSPPDCCTQCSETGMYFPVTFEVNNPQEVKAIKVHYNVLRPNYLVTLVLTEYEACFGENCYGRYSSVPLIPNKGGEGDYSVGPMIESGITHQKYKIRAELQNPIGTTREDTDVFIKMVLIREIPQTVTSTTIPSPVTTTVTTTIPTISPTTIITTVSVPTTLHTTETTSTPTLVTTTIPTIPSTTIIATTVVPTTLHTTAITTSPTLIPTTGQTTVVTIVPTSSQTTSLTTAPPPTITSTPTSSVEKLLEEQNKKIDAQNTIAEQNDLLSQILNYFKGIFSWK